MERTTRWSGADWASESKQIMIIGQGGIGSWLSLNLSRIGHSLYLVDDDRVDETNVTGGQMFKANQIGSYKTNAVAAICREFGCENTIDCINEKYKYEEIGTTKIMITGLDNMKARRETFEAWKILLTKYNPEEKADFLFIDGRLTIEMWEIFAIRGNDEKTIEAFERDHLFTDEEAIALDCSTKQSTFAAMSIAASITSTLCNFLTNRKLGEEVRTTPFYQRMYFPINMYESDNITTSSEEVENNEPKTIVTNE